MIDINLSPEQELIKETARDFANTQLLPGVIERDENQIFPKDEIKKSLQTFLSFIEIKDLSEIKEIDLRQHNQIIVNG